MLHTAEAAVCDASPSMGCVLQGRFVRSAHHPRKDGNMAAPSRRPLRRALAKGQLNQGTMLYCSYVCFRTAIGYVLADVIVIALTPACHGLSAGQAGGPPPSVGRQVHDPGPSTAPAHMVPEAVPVSTHQVVQCLAQLDGIDEAKAYLSYNARAQVWKAVLK
jgi:hypothetical protein